MHPVISRLPALCGIAIPPDAVLFSCIKGDFVYCLFWQVLFQLSAGGMASVLHITLDQIVISVSHMLLHGIFRFEDVAQLDTDTALLDQIAIAV